MTKEEFGKLREFVRHLPALRIQVSDTQLLDQCEQALHDLLDYVADDFEERADPFPEPEAEPKYPEPAHIEEVVTKAPPEFRREPEPVRKVVEQLEPERSRVSHKAPHRKTPHKR